MSNEESEFDQDDEHEHVEDCGHTPAHHERVERLQRNMKKFLADNAEDMLEDGQYAKLKGKVDRHLHRAGMASTLQTLKIFRAGFEFGMIAFLNVPNQIGPIFAGVNKMVEDKQRKGPKMDIDITKSQPLPKKEDEAE